MSVVVVGGVVVSKLDQYLVSSSCSSSRRFRRRSGR